MDKIPVAIAQAKPIFLDLEACLAKVEKLAREGAKQGVKLMVFGETWLPGYPIWLDYCPNMGLWNHEPTKEVFEKTYSNSISVPGPETQRLGQLAKELNISLVIGVNEKIATGTLYNSLLMFGEDGSLLNHHRKLMPTYTEKLVHTQGDGAGLKVVEASGSRLGGLICWEHWMPHARQTLHNQAEEIHVALWPNVHEMHQVASRHYAFEGRCFVLAAGQLIQVKDMPSELELKEDLKDKPEAYLLKGGSCIIGPDGAYIHEPLWEKEELLIAELDLKTCIREKMNLDVSGHYARPDVFTFRVNQKREHD